MERIALVDDSAYARDGLELGLNRVGHEVTISCTQVEAVALSAETLASVTLAVIDITCLPDEHNPDGLLGCEVVSKFRQSNPRATLVAFSSLAHDDAVRARLRGQRVHLFRREEIAPTTGGDRFYVDRILNPQRFKNEGEGLRVANSFYEEVGLNARVSLNEVTNEIIALNRETEALPPRSRVARRARREFTKRFAVTPLTVDGLEDIKAARSTEPAASKSQIERIRRRLTGGIS